MVLTMCTVNRLEPLMPLLHRKHEPKGIKARPQEQSQGHLVRWVGIWPASTQEFYDDCIGAGRNGLYKPYTVALFFQGPHGHPPPTPMRGLMSKHHHGQWVAVNRPYLRVLANDYAWLQLGGKGSKLLIKAVNLCLCCVAFISLFWSVCWVNNPLNQVTAT